MLEAHSPMILARTLVVAPIIFGLLVWASAGYAQDKSKSAGSEAIAQLYAAGKKEGTVVIWGPTDAIIYQCMQAALDKQYPGIKIEHFESIPEPLVQRIIAESQAGKPAAVDIIQSGSLRALRPLIDRDMLAPYAGWEKDFGRDAVGKALQDSMRDAPRLIIIGQNLASHALKQLAETYGEERVRDCSISESAMVGMAVGAAMKGWKAVVMIAYADIASVCHMAIVQSAAKLYYLTNGRLHCPVIIRLPIARFRGHGPEGNEVGVSWFYNVPDLNIAMPGSANEAYWNFREALHRNTPTLFFEDRSLHNRSGEIGADNSAGNAQVTRSGDRLTIVAAGRAAALAEDVADALALERVAAMALEMMR